MTEISNHFGWLPGAINHPAHQGIYCNQSSSFESLIWIPGQNRCLEGQKSCGKESPKKVCSTNFLSFLVMTLRVFRRTELERTSSNNEMQKKKKIACFHLAFNLSCWPCYIIQTWNVIAEQRDGCVPWSESCFSVPQIDQVQGHLCPMSSTVRVSRLVDWKSATNKSFANIRITYNQ